MIFIEKPDPEDPLKLVRRVSECGRIEVFLYRVMYGFRVRAGFSGCMTCELDWCAGADPGHIRSLYSLCVYVLSKKAFSRSMFQDIPSRSAVKPYFNDEQFLKTLAGKLDDDFEVLDFETPKLVPLLFFPKPVRITERI